jgi:hypothetical protein
MTTNWPSELLCESKLKMKLDRRLSEGSTALRVASAASRWPHS